MAAANAAYYAKKDPFADFITAPEISQMFGEMLAVWILNVMPALPESPVALVEAGPGRGTLMADILRVIQRTAPDLYQRCNLYLVETSPRLRAVQKTALQAYPDRPVQWLDSVSDLPEMPMIFIANEFLDALPVRQFVYKGKEEWAEHYVYQAGMIEKPVQSLPAAPIFNRQITEGKIAAGDIVEVCEVGQVVIEQVTRHLCHYGGVALFIDYGYAQNLCGDTLQAIANRQKTSPFVAMGEADLTTHVDFLAMREVALKQGGQVPAIQTQGEFLKQLGIILRANRLMAQANAADQQEIAQALRRLTDPQEMGTLFKVMAIAHPAMPPLPAFDYV